MADKKIIKKGEFAFNFTESVVTIELLENGLMPKQKSGNGYDIYNPEKTCIQKNSIRRIRCGFKIACPDDTYAEILGRSSMTMQRLIVYTGLIDSNYRGEVMVMMHNMSDSTLYLKKGIRMAQIVFKPVHRVRLIEILKVDSDTERGEGGFGSTGQ